jgi:hypothetical protein
MNYYVRREKSQFEKRKKRNLKTETETMGFLHSAFRVGILTLTKSVINNFFYNCKIKNFEKNNFVKNNNNNKHTILYYFMLFVFKDLVL